MDAYQSDLDAALARLQLYPLQGRLGKMQTRSLTVRQHSVVCRLTDSAIEILRIMHHRQDPTSWSN